jgi:cell division protein FtsB
MAHDRPTPAASPRAHASAAGRLRRIIHMLLVLLAGAIVVDGVVGERGLLTMRRARRDSQKLEAAIARQREENAALAERVRRLLEDPSAIEELARSELGLIRPGEYVYTIRDLAASRN